jgi:phenylacetate-CoA ligase
MTRERRNRGDIYSKVVKHLIAPLWAIKERSPYLKHLKYLERSQYRPIDEVRNDQWRRFKKLLNHAYNNVEYYREHMRGDGISSEDLNSWDDLLRLPILTKDDIRENKDRMVARNIDPKRLIPKKTSGSTGVSLEFYVNEESLEWKRACTIKYDRWAGADIGEKVGAIWGNPEYKKTWRGYVRNFILERCISLDTLRMGEEAMLKFYNQLKRSQPTLIYGHAHSLYLFAQFLRTKGCVDIRPRGIISTCMVLHDFERKVIENAFECRVTNRYGCEEVSLIACECKRHKGLHLNFDTLIVEFIRDGKPVKAGEAGAIVVTDLTNYGMPFIRYKVGDVGIPSDQFCNCGCSYPLMEGIEGRVADYIVTPDGNYISGISLTENFAMCLPMVKQMQIIQEKINYIILRIVRDPHFNNETIKAIDRLFLERFGNQMKYSLDFVESIQQEQSGKYRFCISKVQNPFS